MVVQGANVNSGEDDTYMDITDAGAIEAAVHAVAKAWGSHAQLHPRAATPDSASNTEAKSMHTTRRISHRLPVQEAEQQGQQDAIQQRPLMQRHLLKAEDHLKQMYRQQYRPHDTYPLDDMRV